MKLYFKNNPTIEYIECTPEELQKFLEREIPNINRAVEELTENCATTYVLLVD